MTPTNKTKVKRIASPGERGVRDERVSADGSRNLMRVASLRQQPANILHS